MLNDLDSQQTSINLQRETSSSNPQLSSFKHSLKASNARSRSRKKPRQIGAAAYRTYGDRGHRSSNSRNSRHSHDRSRSGKGSRHRSKSVKGKNQRRDFVMQKVYSTAYQIDRSGHVNAARESSGHRQREPSGQFENPTVNVNTRYETMGL